MKNTETIEETNAQPITKIEEIIATLEPHRKIISGAIAFRKDHPDRQESAIRGFVKNNAAILGIENSARLCVNWGLVVEHFKEVA